MAKLDVLDILMAKRTTPLEFNFDSLMIPPIWYYLTQEDVNKLRHIATSARLSSKIDQKYQMIDDIMRNRGFKRFSAGTNRVVYRFLEDDRFLVKIAVDKVGMQDNPMEYKNQFLLKPYVTKMFYTSQCGVVGFVERVIQIKNKAEFKEIAGDVFEILVNKVLGKYVVEDVGVKYFMNWGVRIGSGPVLLDYPYIYKLDGKKLFCTKTDPTTNIPCNGEIDYDCGFNHLVCTKCGKIYLASDLRDNQDNNKIIIKGGREMKIVMKEGDKIVYTSVPTDEVIRPARPTFKNHGLTVGINNGDGNIIIVSGSSNNCERINIADNIHTVDETEIHTNNSDIEINNQDDGNDTVEEEVIHTSNASNDESDKEDDSEEESNNSITEESDAIVEQSVDNDEGAVKRTTPSRDSNGRFISTGSSKKPKKEKVNRIKSTFIPSKD